MTHRYLPLAAVVLAATAVPALAQQAVAPTAQVAIAPAAAENPDDKVKCRSMPIIGSLAKKARICRTVAEWRLARERGNDAARDITDYSRTRPNG